jgi:hypothetical protein
VPRQLGTGGVVESHAGGTKVLGQMGTRPGAGDKQDVRCEVEQPGERHLYRCRAQSYPKRGEHGAGEQVVPHVTGPSQGAEGDEGDLLFRALGENVRGVLVGQVEEVLHADDLRLIDGSQRMPNGGRPR